MPYSINECRAIARLAARGNGLSWGLAEDAGLAAAWLAARKLPFAAAFCDSKESSPPKQNTVLRGELHSADSKKMLCPFFAGAMICDLARARPLRWKVCNTANPIILLPFAAFAANAVRCAVQIKWQGAKIISDGKDAAVLQNKNIAAIRADVHIAPCSLPCNFNATIAPVSQQCKIPAKEWKKLAALAARTFVANTPESRRGAGE